MRFRVGDRVRIHSDLRPNHVHFGSEGIIEGFHYSHLKRLYYDVKFDFLYAVEMFIEEELELLYRPSINELLTDESECIRQFAKEVL